MDRALQCETLNLFKNIRVNREFFVFDIFSSVQFKYRVQHCIVIRLPGTEEKGRSLEH